MIKNPKLFFRGDNEIIVECFPIYTMITKSKNTKKCKLAETVRIFINLDLKNPIKSLIGYISC